MNTTDPGTVPPRLWQDRRDATNLALGKYLSVWIGPALFALLISATIRFHSLLLTQTMPRMVGNLLAFAAVALIVLLARGCRLTVPRDVVLLLTVLAGSIAVSVLGSGNTDVSLLRLELYLSMVLFATVVYLLYRGQSPVPLAGFFLAVALVHLLFLFPAIQWVSEMEPPFWPIHGVRIADFANVRQFGEFGFLAAVGASALGLLSRRWTIPSLLLASCALFGIVLTGSRGAVLSWVLFVLLACCFSQTRVRAAVHGLVAFGLSAGLVYYLDHSGLLVSPNIFARIASEQLGEESFDTSRLAIWRMSLEQIMARPLFGSGPEGYWISGCCDRRILQAHNFVLQFLLEFGLIGCGLVVLLGARAMRAMGGAAGTVQRVLATPGNRALACLLASFLAYSLIDQMLYHLLPLLHFALFAGLFAAGLAQAGAASARSLAARV
jgi:O-antigen ligase